MVKRHLLASLLLVIASAIAFVGLTTTRVSAGDTVVDNVTLTIPVACTLSSTLDTPHTATINNGTYAADIGTTTFTTFCNDSNGYSIYAIGYSGEKYTNTKLLATAGGVLTPSSDINTGIATSGATSAWAMKLNPVTGTYAPTITSDTEGSFSSYHTVPSNYTKVATLTSGTDFTIGSKLQTTYRVYISPTQSAGSYNGKVKYTMVHPHDAAAPNLPVVTDPGYISYNPNVSGVTDSMGDQAVTSDATEAVLWASNFQRSGYGFAGWTDNPNYQLNSGNNSTVGHIYGPNETIDDSTTLASIQSDGLSLYAVWVPSAGNLQGWTGCNSLTQGNVTALTDQRDNQVYAVAKLADGKCWMMENLRLNNDASHNSDGTLAQGYAGVFAGLANRENSYFANVTYANSLYYSGTQSGTATIDIGTTNPSYRFPRFNNRNTASPVSNMTSANSNVYSYGNYYTWSAAMANTNNYTGATAQVDGKTSETVNTSICPSGWRLPYGRNTGNGATAGGFSKLDIELGGTGADSSSSTTPTGAEMSKLWRKYPNNFVLPGRYTNYGLNDRSTIGEYWSSTANNSTYSHRLVMHNSSVNPGVTNSYKYWGISVRCVISS